MIELGRLSKAIASRRDWFGRRWSPRAKSRARSEPLSVDVHIEPAGLQQMLAHVENCWRRLGETEPHWSVLTNDQFKSDRIAEAEAEFYASGAGDFERFTEAAARCGLALPFRGTCFELGCGVGRVTLSLAKAFDRVVGADISSSHVAVADQAVRSGGYENVELRLLDHLVCFEQLPVFDAFFSLIVLQHNPPPVIAWLLHQILSKLKLGGVAFFQLPTFLPNYGFDAQAYLAHPPTHGHMEVHALPYPEVLRIFEETGCELVDAREYDCLGIPNSTSINFLAIKKTLSPAVPPT